MRIDNQIYMAEEWRPGISASARGLINHFSYLRKKKKILNLKTLIHANENIGYRRKKKMHKKHER